MALPNPEEKISVRFLEGPLTIDDEDTLFKLFKFHEKSTKRIFVIYNSSH